MSRLFTGTTDQVTWSIGSVVGTGAWTFAFIMKLSSGLDSSWHSMLNLDASGTVRLGTTRKGTGNTFSVSLAGESSFSDSVFTFGSGDGWCVLTASRPAGAAQTVRVMKYPVGGSPTLENAPATLGNASAPTSLYFGNIGGSDDFQGRVAAIAFFDSQLNDTQTQSLQTTLTRANWQSFTPKFLVDELDAFVTDYGGTSTRTGLTGTADDADDPTGWASWAGAPPSGGGEASIMFPRWVR